MIPMYSSSGQRLQLPLRHVRWCAAMLHLLRGGMGHVPASPHARRSDADHSEPAYLGTDHERRRDGLGSDRRALESFGPKLTVVGIVDYTLELAADR